MTDDLISREAALECCNEMLRKSKPLEKSTSAIELRRAIAALPAAQVQAEPLVRTYWHYECPDCEWDTVRQEDSLKAYCPVCAGDNGRDVTLRRRRATDDDGPAEGRDDRFTPHRTYPAIPPASAFASQVNALLQKEIAAGAAEAGVTPEEYLRTATDMLRKLRATTPAPDDLDALVAWLHRAYPNDERVSQAADAITALRARPATVQVKPLVWEKSHIAPWYDDWHTVPTGYTIRCADENGWKWSNGQGAFGYDPTASSAKAAAQADYEVRIRAALVASEPAPGSHQPPLPSSDAQGGEV